MRRRIGGWAFLLLASTTAGCGDPARPTEPPPRPTFAGTSLVVAVLGDPAIVPGLRAGQGEWEASSRGSLGFREASDDPGGADVLVFPGDRLGDLVDRGALLALADEALVPPPPPPGGGDEAVPAPVPDAFAFKEIAPAFRDGVTKYGDDRMGLPLGGSALVLAFRRAAFDREANRAAAASAGIALDVPRTWADLDALARFFHGRDWDGDGKADAGIALAWASDPEGVGDATFLARAASLGQHPDQYSFLFDSDRMRPRVASPPFVEALGALVGLAKLAPPGALAFDAEAARAAFRSGRVALLIDRAERASTWSEGEPVGVAPLPGSDRVWNPARKAWEAPRGLNLPAYLPRGGGWLVGVAAATAHREAATDLARYLAGPEMTNRLRSDRAFPMLAARTPQLGQGPGDPRSAPGVEPRGWTDAVARTIAGGRAVVGLRVPGADGYLADLAKGRAEAAGGRPAEDALKAVAAAWDARTDALGRDRQTWHYRRSLNRLATEPRPPPRGK